VEQRLNKSMFNTDFDLSTPRFQQKITTARMTSAEGRLSVAKFVISASTYATRQRSTGSRAYKSEEHQEQDERLRLHNTGRHRHGEDFNPVEGWSS
jgi:hypothetical protein